jgi:HK97 family phage major capsid protein
MRLAVIGTEETAFYNGNGVARPLGVLSSAASVDRNRATANQISYADIVAMYAKLKMGGSPVWIASQTCIPQLCTIADASSHNLWVQSAAPGIPPTLLGIPVLFHDRSVALGTRGDLILADLSYYVIKNGSGPFVMASEHVYFTSNRTVIKIFWNVDGKPWLDEPLPLEGSTTNTVSPFVVLN